MQSNISSFCIYNVYLKYVNFSTLLAKWRSILKVGHKFLI